MDLYLPIANLSVNAIVIVLLGGGVGLLSGMFGVGGGFLTTPLLIVYGIPPTVAAASSASQVTGASVSGVFAHFRRAGVDVKMTEQVFGRVEYRYTDFGAKTFDTGSGPQSIDSSNHRVMFGLGLTF